jgi:CobQ-like glutamine amidotransferase family enzyme
MTPEDRTAGSSLPRRQPVRPAAPTGPPYRGPARPAATPTGARRRNLESPNTNRHTGSAGRDSRAAATGEPGRNSGEPGPAPDEPDTPAGEPGPTVDEPAAPVGGSTATETAVPPDLADPGPATRSAGSRGRPANGDSTVTIALLFPELLGTYGDGGNAVILAKRLEWRGITARILQIEAGEPVPHSCDLYLLGGGEDGPQTEAARELNEQRSLHRAVDGGATVFAVCAGMQILGETFPDKSGARVAGLGLLDCRTIRTGEPRAVGELLVAGAGGLPRLTGFENHGGRTRLGPDARPLGPVVAGVGNGDGTEGVMDRTTGDDGSTRGRVLGTYLHGPGLARNPALADRVLAWVLGVDPDALERLDERETELLRADRFRAVERGSLDGVASRSWRDRLLRRN